VFRVVFLLKAGRVAAPWTCYQELFRNDSSNMHTCYQLIWSNLQRCDWDDLERKLTDLREGTNNYSADLDTPFEALAFPGLTSSDHYSVARSYAHRYVGAGRNTAESTLTSPADRSARRLKVGYLSADFRSHPVGYVLPEVIERHNRSRVEVHGYSTGISDKSAARNRLASAFEHFADVSNDSPQQVISRIHADGIDILVDLNGWTTGNRPEVLVARCAPIQVNWVGYPGTMGHPVYADYIIGDALVTPETHATFFSELIAQLPHSYLPADTTRSIAAPPARSDVALPEAAFVFCSFNNRHKLNSGLFDVWCEILRQAADSVLWLTDPGDSAVTRLRQEAVRRGVDADRLIFAPRVEDPLDHLARIQLADVALDTFPYNAHSSGIDALWAGVPMVTCLGETFASRVGASLVTACALPDLVTKSAEDYVALAVRIYRDHGFHAAVRSRLADRRQTPLFDMPGFVDALEALFDRMWAQHLAGVKAPIYR
jgi:predicted O-linked N-acetylglucosamine transferase (SPINDLY family)